MKNTLMTNRTFLSLSIPYLPDKQTEFEKALMRDGCRKPILVWNGVIIDGYKRYRFCCDEGIEYTVEDMEFPSEEEAVSWICRKRIPLCDKLTPAYRYLIGRLYIAQKQIFQTDKKLPEEERMIHFNTHRHRISCLVGEETNLFRSTIEAYGSYTESMNQIADKSWQLFQALLSGSVKLTAKEIHACAEMSEWRIKSFCRKKFDMSDNGYNPEKIRNRKRKEPAQEPEYETPLVVGIKEMPVYDPDMELRGLTLTISTWIMAIRRVEDKTGGATELAKKQLAGSLNQLKEEIDEMLGVINHG